MTWFEIIGHRHSYAVKVKDNEDAADVLFIYYNGFIRPTGGFIPDILPMSKSCLPSRDSRGRLLNMPGFVYVFENINP